MGTPAAVVGDRIMGTCGTHQIPNPSNGSPMPAPPMPFSAPITLGVVATVLIAGKPAVTVGCSGVNLPPHVGLHPADPFMAGPAQIGRVVAGSTTVLIGGKPAAKTGVQVLCCVQPGQLVGSATTVLVGG